MEQYTNLAASTLSSGITSSATSLTLVSATNFPTSGKFRLVIGTELLLCTAISGTTLTVTRGIEGTTAAAHAGGEVVSHVLTVASLQRIILEYGLQHEPPSASFTWANQDTATVTSGDRGILLQNLTDAGSVWDVNARVKSRTTGDYKLTAGFSANLGVQSFGMAGIGIRNTSNDRFEILRFHNDGNDCCVSVVSGDQFSGSVNPSGQSSNFVVNFLINPSQVWLQIEEISGVTYFRVGNNGLDWLTIHSRNVSDFIVTSDGVFFGIVPYSRPVSMRLFYWSEQ